MKSIILTIRLKYFYLTYKGIKTIEVRKTKTKDFVGDVYEYVSKTNWEKDLLEIPENERDFFKKFVGKIGLKFTLNKVEEIRFIMDYNCGGYYNIASYSNEKAFERDCCLTQKELDVYINKDNYYKRDKNGYAWHIDNLVIFDKPKELSEFNKYGCKQYDNDVRAEYGKRGHLYTNCFFHLTKAPMSWCYIESEE